MATRQIVVAGSLTISPQSVVGTTLSSSPSGLVPAGVTQLPIQAIPSPKPAAKMGGGNKVCASALGSYVALSGVGATDDVTTADTLLITTDAPMQFQLTLQNLAAAGVGTITSVLTVYGTVFLQFPPQGYLTALSASGNGNVEYLVSGPA